MVFDKVENSFFTENFFCQRILAFWESRQSFKYGTFHILYGRQDSYDIRVYAMTQQAISNGCSIKPT